MNRFFPAASLAAGVLFCFACETPLHAQTGASALAPTSEKPVTAALLANAETVEPGTTLTLGVLFKMAPEWHIYWRNPGETGFATEVQWLAGADSPLAGETLYPAPVTFTSPGDLTSFGYEKEVLLITEVAVPADATGELQFTAKAKWLMCSDRCIPGRDTLTLTVSVGGSKPANADLFDRYRAQLPKAYAPGQYPTGVRGSAKGSGNKLEAALVADPAPGRIVGETRHDAGLHRLYFFPYPGEKGSGVVVGTPTVPEPDSTTETPAGQVKVYTKPVTITVGAEAGDASKPAPKQLKGVLVIQRLSGEGKPQPPEQAEISL